MSNPKSPQKHGLIQPPRDFGKYQHRGDEAWIVSHSLQAPNLGNTSKRLHIGSFHQGSTALKSRSLFVVRQVRPGTFDGKFKGMEGNEQLANGSPHSDPAKQQPNTMNDLGIYIYIYKTDLAAKGHCTDIKA